MNRSAHRARVLGIASLIIVGALSWGVSFPSPAEACSIDSHCYGLALGPKSGIIGDYVVIAPSCLSTPSVNFATDELWLVDVGSTTHWVEVGYMQLGANLNVGGIVGAGRYGFWGDFRPGHTVFFNHVMVTNPSLASTNVEITRTSSSTWETYFGPTTTGESTSNTMTPTEGQWGSETSSASVTSHYAGTDAEYETSSGWYTGVPNEQVPTPSAPETFSWTSKPANYTSGVAC
jgi:hypothetical protein